MENSDRLNFEQAENQEALTRFSHIFKYISPAVNVYFILIDYIIGGASFYMLLSSRVLMLLLWPISILLEPSRFYKKYAVPYIAIYAWAHSFLLAWASTRLGDLTHPYIASAPSTIAVATWFVFLSDWRKFLFINTINYAIFYSAAWVEYGAPDLAPSLLFLGGYINFTVIPLLGSWVTYGFRVREFNAQRELHKEVESRNQIINDKVAEILAASNQLRVKDSELIKAKYESESFKRVADVTFRVAHDIRSPLTALNMVVSTLGDANYEQKNLIWRAVSRISEIAEGLLSDRKRILSKDFDKDKVFSVTLAVQQVLSEKRLIHRTIKFEYMVAENAYDSFLTADRSQFQSMIANMAENGVDSYDGGEGRVLIHQDIFEGKLRLRIQDWGKGIEDGIKNSLGRISVTSKGTKGSGIGVRSAFTFVERYSGSIQYASEVGKGTEVEITLPKSDSEKWFCPQIDVSKVSQIVTVDDDPSVHQVWRNRLRDCSKEQVEISSLVDFENCKAIMPNALILMDYYFSNEDRNGFEFLVKLPSSYEKILVTSEYDSSDLRQQCIEHGIKMVPKSLISIVPITSRP